jgi:hypothetical protein
MKPLEPGKNQQFKLTWYCDNCGMKISIGAIRTHTINGHTVNQVSYEPEFKEKGKKK